jgi:hypothetical protein
VDLQKSRNHVQFNGTGNTAPGGRVVSNIFDEYLPKLIIRIETPEIIWEVWDL